MMRFKDLDGELVRAHFKQKGDKILFKGGLLKVNQQKEEYELYDVIHRLNEPPLISDAGYTFKDKDVETIILVPLDDTF